MQSKFTKGGGGGVPVVLRHRNASDLRDIADEVIFF